MRYIKTKDFDEFRCIAGECPESCCLSWQIVIDDESLVKYSEMKGDFANRLKNSIDWLENCFMQYNGRCALLNDEGYCDLQLEKGEEALCDTCDQYPRHMEDFEGVREYSLSLSCPEAARVYCENLMEVEFSEYEDDEEDEDFEEFDYMLYSNLTAAREDLFAIIKDRKVSLLKRMEKVLRYVRLFQKYYDEEDYDSLAAISASDAEQEAWVWKDDLAHFKELFELEHLREGFTDILNASYEFWYGKDIKILDELSEEESRAGENILMVLIYTYFCGAVYDDMIFSKAAIAVYMVRWIIMLHRAAGDGMKLSEMVYRVCREIEHSDNNLNDLDLYFMEYYSGI